MRAAFYTIDRPDIMEPMNTQEARGFFKTVLQDIVNKYVCTKTNRSTEKKKYLYVPKAFRIKN